MSDRTPDSRDFDPRFDPAFQPGYDAGNDPVAAARGTSTYAAQFVESPDVRVEPSRVTPAPLRHDGAQHPSAPTPAAVVGDGRSSPGGGSATADAALHTPAALDSSGLVLQRSAAGPLSVRNPFLIAIWVASAAFLLGGFALLRWLPMVSQQTQTSTGSNYDYLIVQSAVIGAPLLIVLGLTSAVASLFLFAVRWRPRSTL